MFHVKNVSLYLIKKVGTMENFAKYFYISFGPKTVQTYDIVSFF